MPLDPKAQAEMDRNHRLMLDAMGAVGHPAQTKQPATPVPATEAGHAEPKK